MWDLYVDYNAVQWNIYVQYGRHICSEDYNNNNNVNVCIQVIVVTLLIALSSYEAYIMT